MGDKNEALDAITRATIRYPEYAPYHLVRAILAIELSKFYAAEEEIEALESSEIEDYAYSLKGKILNKKGEFDKAIEQINHAIELDSSQYYHYACRAESYIGKKEYTKAIDDAIKAVELDDHDSNVVIRNVFLVLANEAPVQTFVKLAHTGNVTLYEIYTDALLKICENRGEALLLAVKDYQKEYEENRDNTDSVGFDYIEMHTNALLVAFKLCTNMAEGIDDDYYSEPVQERLRSAINIYMSTCKKADKLMQPFIGKHPETISGLLIQADFKSRIGDKDGRLETLNEHIKRHPHDPLGYFKRSVFFIDINNHEESTRDMNRCLELANEQDNLLLMCRAYCALGHNSEFETTANEVVKLGEMFPSITVAVMFYSRSMLDDSLDLFTKLLEKYPPYIILNEIFLYVGIREIGDNKKIMSLYVKYEGNTNKE